MCWCVQLNNPQNEPCNDKNFYETYRMKVISVPVSPIKPIFYVKFKPTSM